MSVHIVRLGTPRSFQEGLRLGTVRRPPRGVPKAKFASENWYDLWLPNLAPTVPARTPAQWNVFTKKYRSEMKRPENARVIQLLAALSHQTNFSVGCYCEDESHCHRSVLRSLLRESGAEIA